MRKVRFSLTCKTTPWRLATGVALRPLSLRRRPPLTKGEFPQCSTQADSLHP